MLAGKRIKSSFANNTTAGLWRNFMPCRNKILNTVNQDLISMSIYKPGYFMEFNPENEFEKWAAVEVTNFENVPVEFETFIVPAGLYAVFHYRGLSSDNSIFQYIYGTWLPDSGYVLDERPHFEVLGEKYKNNAPDSEEEIWIPLKKKS